MKIKIDNRISSAFDTIDACIQQMHRLTQAAIAIDAYARELRQWCDGYTSAMVLAKNDLKEAMKKTINKRNRTRAGKPVKRKGKQ